MNLLYANDGRGTYPASYYAASTELLDPQPVALGALRADVAIVGAGFSGLNAALTLAQAGYDVVVLEAQRIGFGASGRNGGQVASGQREDQNEIERIMGRDDARKLWDIAQAANQRVRDLSADMPDCQVRDGVIHAAHRVRYVGHEHAYVDKLRSEYGYDKITPLTGDELHGLVKSPRYYGGSLDLGAGHIHPLRYVIGLARKCLAAGVRIYERSEVTAINPDSTHITCAQGQIDADHIVLACNGYLGELQPQVAQRVMPINNFIAATVPLSDTQRNAILACDHAVADSKFVVNYFRWSDDQRMLFGGSESYGYRFARDIARVVRRPMVQIYPQLRDVKIDYAWGGTLAITMRRLPYFARLTPRITNISGYSGSGVAMATMGGYLVAQMIMGQAERFDVMARIPTQRFIGGPTMRQPLLVAAMLWYQLRDLL